MINLDRRPDRCQEFVERINALNLILPNFQRFSAIDGKDLFGRFPKLFDNEQVVDFLKHALTNQLWTTDWMITEGKEGRWRDGEIGCLLSHYNIFLNMKDDETLQDNDFWLVLEDDIFMNPDFEQQLKLIGETLVRPSSKVSAQDIDVIWIAGRGRPHFEPSNAYNDTSYHNVEGQLYIRRGIEKGHVEDWYRQTTAYLITKRGARRLVEQIRQQDFVRPIDHCMTEANVRQYDWFPHLGYSPMDYKTDVQTGEEVTPYSVLRIVLFNQYKKVRRIYQGLQS